MKDPSSLDLPIRDPAEVAAFLDSMPLAVDRQQFTRFVLGFPRRYLTARSRAEIVKHFAMMDSRAGRSVVSALGREGALWKLDLICRDRQLLFSRIAGSLTAHGMNIVSAEAFANESAFVLDTFRFADPEGVLEPAPARPTFQAFLEEAVVGQVDLEPLLGPRLAAARRTSPAGLRVTLDNDSHPSATHLRLESPDFFGLLYLVSRVLAETGCNIEMAFVRTPSGKAEDIFFLTREGAPLDAALRRELAERLGRLGGREGGTPP